jgi:hypothetical protein
MSPGRAGERYLPYEARVRQRVRERYLPGLRGCASPPPRERRIT